MRASVSRERLEKLVDRMGRAASGPMREIEPELFRFPAIDPPSFRRAVVAMLDQAWGDQEGEHSKN